MGINQAKAPRGSEGLREFRRKGALRLGLAFTGASTGAALRAVRPRRFRSRGSSGGRGSAFRCDRSLGGLCGVCSEDLVLKRCAIKTTDDRLHFVSCRSLDKRESLGFLRFVVPDHLDRIRYKIFRRQPLFNVVSGDPNGQIAQKNGKAH